MAQHIKEKKRFKIYGPTRAHPLVNARKFLWRESESKSRQLFSKQELDRLVLGSLWRNDLARKSLLTRDFIHEARFALNSKGALSKLKTRCIFIGHSRAVYRKLFMTRHTLRKFVRFGHLPGFVNT